MSRRLLILALLIVGTSYASLLSSSWPSQLDPTFVVSGASTVAPILTSISPAAGARGATVTVVVTGSNFLEPDYHPAKLNFVSAATPPIDAGDVTILSTSLLTADVVIPLTAPTGTVFVYVYANDGSSNQLTFTVTEGLGCNIQMNKQLLANGDSVIAQSVRVTNPSALPQQIHYRFWLDITGFPPVVFAQGGADGSVVLTPGFNSELGPISLFQVSEPLPRGTYAFGCRFVDTVRGNVLAESVQPFFVQ